MSRTLERSKPKSHWQRALITLLGILLTAALIFLTLSRYLAVAEVRLPNLIGLSSEEAVRILADLKLEPVLFSEDIENAIVNAVSSQSPQAATIVRQGRSVAVGINRPEVRITIPSFIDMSYTNALTMIANLGLELGETNYDYSDIAAGRIMTQDPSPGTLASNSRRVLLTVSRGPEPTRMRMPDLKGLSIDDAKQRLKSMGISRIETSSSGVSFDRPGLITAQMPEAGNFVTAGSHVILAAPLSTQVISQVPQLLGVPLSQAQMQLNAAGLRLGAVTYISDPAQPPGIVSFTPSAYTLRDTPIELVVNREGLTEPISNLSISAPLPVADQTTATANTQAPSTDQIVTETLEPDSSEAVSTSINPIEPSVPNSRQIPITFNPVNLGVPSLMEQSYKFKLMVNDDRGERLIIERIVQPGESVNANLLIYGNATVQTYINDILFQAWNP